MAKVMASLGIGPLMDKKTLWNSKCAFVFLAPILLSTLLSAGCRRPSNNPTETGSSADLTGAWKAKIQFQTGAFAGIKDLEFMYVFNAGGTMTESSNYDAAPPVPPAYGVWKKLSPNDYVARYEFYITRAPSPAESASASGGWLPAGHGVLTERITLSTDGTSFTSKIRYEAYDPLGKPAEGGGQGTGRGVRQQF